MTYHPRDKTSRDSQNDEVLSEDALLETDLLLPPAGAAKVFGDRLSAAERYVFWLAGAGLERGLMGPRERPRLWDRHVLNSAAAAEAIPEGARVIDIGSGAGLPGIPLALARPDLRMILIEPLLRRATFLQEVVSDLQLRGTPLTIEVVRGRAEEKAVITAVGNADVVTSRAVAPLGKLLSWSVPLLRPGGEVIALKGSSAAEELERDRAQLVRLGLEDAQVRTVSAPDAEATHLVCARLGDKMVGRRGRRR